jgi:putative phage-type endonuclease
MDNLRNAPQGSPEWLAARCGRVTASRMADLMARTKSGWGASRNNYMAELIAERLTGCPATFFVNDAMRHGTEQEPYARRAYAESFGVDVLETGFVPHPELDMAGASPDGLIGDDGMLEIKAPNTSTHIETLLGAPIAEKYVLQMQWQMATTGRSYCDFASFDPRLPENMRLHVRRVPRDVSLILDLETEVAAFIREIDEKVARLTETYQQKDAA